MDSEYFIDNHITNIVDMNCIEKLHNSGIKFTHVLSLNIHHQILHEDQINHIRMAIKEYVSDKQIVEHIEVHTNNYYPVIVHWKMPSANSNCSHFYTNSGILFNDNAIKNHTKMFLQKLTTRIQKQYPQYGTEWCLTYLITGIVDFGVANR